MPLKKENPDATTLGFGDLFFIRDNFVNGLNALEDGIQQLKRAYITQFNTLLPENHPGRVSLPFPYNPPLTRGTELTGVPPVVAAPPQFSSSNSTGTKKRKPHDPNAPKRALTSYFLFMQHNKPKIKEKHPDWTAQQISDESEKRWSNISDKDRADYEYMYQVDLARYYKQKECYERGEAVPEIDAEQARRLYGEHLKTGGTFKGRKGKKVIRPVNIPAEVMPQPSSDDEEEDEEEDTSSSEEEQQAPPAKNKRQKMAAASAPMEVPKSPEKKTKKAGRKTKDEETSALKPEPEIASPAKASKKKAGRKSKGGDE